MLKKATIPWTAKMLTNQIIKGNVSFDNAIQRGLKWTASQNSLLIHSMIEGYPIPPLYFQKNEDGKYEALDGKQRSNAISKFINGEYNLINGFEACSDDNGNEYNFSCLHYSELPEWAQDEIKDYSLVIYYFEGLTDDERDSMFYRLNNGKPLTAIELTRVKAKSLSQFQSIAKHNIINLSVTDKGKQSYTHENIAMQIWSALFIDGVSFETKDFRPLIIDAVVTQEQIENISKYLDIVESVFMAFNLEDKGQTKLAKRIITRTHLISLCKAAQVAIETEYPKDDFIDFAKSFFSGETGASIDDDYNEAAGTGSSKKDKVAARFDIIVDNMNRFLKHNR